MEENQEIRSAALDLDTLKTRAARCVCKYCGSPLKVERIMYHNCEAARSELFCPKCGRIEFGVEREVYLAAKYYVDTFHFNMYQGLEDNEQRRRMNIARSARSWTGRTTSLASAMKTVFACPSISSQTRWDAPAFSATATWQKGSEHRGEHAYHRCAWAVV